MKLSFILVSLPAVLLCQTQPPQMKPEPQPTAASDPVVLSVADEKITRSEYEQLIRSMPERVQAQAQGAGKRQIAEELARLKAMSQEARKRGLDKTPKVRQQLDFQRDNVLANALFDELTSGIRLDEAVLRGYYDQHKPDFERVKARHILVRFTGSRVPVGEGKKDLSEAEALAKAQNLRARIDAGEDFAAVAKAESDDPGSAPTGGDLGAFGRGQMTRPFEQTAFALPVGSVSEPVKTEFGYHLLQVQQRAAPAFEEVQTQIQNRLKPELARKAVEKIQGQTPVTIDETYFGKPASQTP